MPQNRLRAVFMRGGTSKALMFRQEDLPKSQKDWAPIFAAAMGSPDPNGRQLDGVGGGVSSLSKVCVIGPPTRPDADVDYTFGQVAVTTNAVDYGGNCGNMSSAVGPFAVDEGLVPAPRDGEATVRIHNTNTGKIIVSHFPVKNGAAATDGVMAIDGVSGTGAPVRLDFTEPGGSKTGLLLPTGRTIDILEIGDFGTLEASLIDSANPCVFVRAGDVNAEGSELPDVIETRSELLAKLELVRQAASVAMGLTKDLAAAKEMGSIPKVAMVAVPSDSPTLSGQILSADAMDIRVRMISMERPHRAVPVTGALCLASACRLPGSIPERFLTEAARRGGSLRIGHPSGVILVDARAGQKEGKPYIFAATIYRTARRLFEGAVLYRARGVNDDSLHKTHSGAPPVQSTAVAEGSVALDSVK